MNKQQLIKYIKNTDLDIQMARAAFFAADLAFGQYKYDLKYLSGINYGPMLCYMLSYNSSLPFHQIMDQAMLEKAARKIYVNYMAGKNTIDMIISDQHDLELQLDRVWQDYSNEKIINDKKLAKYFKKATKIARMWWRYGALGENKGCMIDVEITPKIAKKYKWDIHHAQEIVSALAHPKEQSAFNKERVDFLNICTYISNNKKLKRLLIDGSYREALKDKKIISLIKNYIKNNFWIKSDFCRAEVITPEIMLEEVALGLKSKKNFKKELYDIASNFKKIEKEKIKLFRKLNLDKSDLREIEFAQKLIFWLDERKKQMMKQLYYLFVLLTEVARRKKMSYDQIASYRPKEIVELIIKNEKVSKKIIDQRQKGMMIVYQKGTSDQFYWGKEGKMLLGLVIDTKDKKELRGTVASKANQISIKGIARIVHNPSKDEFNDQEILVTSMTRVEFVPLMRRAKAIITNEGGMACHAAIVSRELGIPAIIGTKVATQMLKNGDKVEMDLERGIVKIIEQKDGKGNRRKN